MALFLFWNRSKFELRVTWRCMKDVVQRVTPQPGLLVTKFTNFCISKDKFVKVYSPILILLRK